MPVTIKFFQFGKKNNSTAQPTTSGTEYQCLFKEPTSLMNPVITLKHENPVGYNYAYINTFGRYYFVTNWEYERGLWYATLNVDVLASWKKEIGASTQYVLRSASESDGTIIDTTYPAFSGAASNSVSIDNPWITNFSAGYFVVGIINSDVVETGAVSYYAFTATGFNKLKQFLLGSGNWLTDLVTDISANLQKELVNPFQYITQCTWFPLSPAINDIPVTTIPFGWWNLTNQDARSVNTSMYRRSTFQFNIPKHPQEAARGVFLSRTSRYSLYSLFFPPFGEISIPAEYLTGSDTLYARVIVDFVTGIGVIKLSPFENFTTIITEATAMIGIPIQIAQINSSPLHGLTTAASGLINVTRGVVQAGVGIETGSLPNIAFGALNIGTSIINASIGSAEAASPTVKTNGATGSMAFLQFPPELRARFNLLVDEDKEHAGRPYCKKVVLNTLSGYIKCADADIGTIATSTENAMTNAFMNGGFYYE